MSDLISRQAAIDMCRKPRMRNADCSDFEMEIMMLPSIYPEIICCRECKHVEHDELFHDYWCKGREVEPNHYCGYVERSEDA